MPEIKKRKKSPPQAETTASPPGRTRVTLTKDVSSRYRKLVPRAKAVSAPTKPPWARESPPKRGPRQKPEARRDGDGRRDGPGPSAAMKALVNRELPEAARQLKETQDLLRTAAEDILNLLETWEQPAGPEPAEEPRDFRALITALFEKMSFQDLAGQRLAKVETFLKALGEVVRPAAPAGRFPPRRSRPFSKDDPERKPSRPYRGRSAPAKSSLKGPQAAGGGLAQQEIEALMADLQGPGPRPGRGRKKDKEK